MKKINIQSIPVILGTLLYGICLLFEAYYIGIEREPQYAFFALILGWVGLFGGYYYWLANPLFIVSLLLYKKRLASVVFGILAFTLAFLFLNLDKVIANEAGMYEPIVGYGVGYYLWLLAMFVYTAGQFCIMCISKETEKIT